MTASFILERDRNYSPAVPGEYYQWQNHRLYSLRAGSSDSSRPPLLLIHGFGASTDHWRKNVAELQNHFEVWAIDLLGFGRSAKPNIPITSDLWRSQVQAFISEKIGRPAILAGNSIGGYVSLSTAAHHPELVKGVILLNCAGGFTDTLPDEQKLSLQQRVGRNVRNLLLHPLPNYFLFQYVRNRGRIRKTLQKVYVDHSAVTDQLVEEIYRPACDRGARQVFAAIFRAPKGKPNDELLKQMECPLLLLWGEGDPWMQTKERSQLFRKYYANIGEHFLNAGHCPHDEIPGQVNQLINNWVEETFAIT